MTDGRMPTKESGSLLLLKASRMDDKIAFERLYWDYHHDVADWFMKANIGADQSNLLTNEVFFRTWLYRKTFRGDCAVKTFLFRVAENVLCEEITKRRLRKALFMPISNIDETYLEEKLAVSETPEWFCNRREIHEHIHRCIYALPLELQKLIKLIWFQGHSQQGAASILGCSRGTVRTNLCKAYRRLAQNLRIMMEDR